MKVHQHPAPSQRDYTLDLTVLTDNADANGTAVNVVQAAVKDGSDWASGETIQFIVTTGHTVFTDSGNNTTTGTTGSQGTAITSLIDSVEETVTVMALAGGLLSRSWSLSARGGR